MDYIKSNKEAWEEAFEHRAPGWCEDIIKRIQEESYPFLQKELVDELSAFDFKNKTIGQFCCNNGRELMALMKFGAEKGVGFDIADNMVAWANNISKKININCKYVATNILEINQEYHNSFDFIFITIGALTWFKDLSAFFDIVFLCLKEGGMLIINEVHPVINMLAFEGENNFDVNSPNKLVNSYFRNEPWIENSGMGYMCNKAYDSKTFCSYSHSLSTIINSMVCNNLITIKLKEFDHDISGSAQNLSGCGIPLSYILIARKQSIY